MRRWWTIASVCGAVGCAQGQQTDIGSTQHPVVCSRDPLPSPSLGESWHWGGGADYPDLVYPNSNDCTGAIYHLPVEMEDPMLGEDGWPDTETELRFALAALSVVDPGDEAYVSTRVILLAGTTEISIDPDPDPNEDEDDNPLVIPANTWLASIRGRPTNNAFNALVPSKGALIASTRRDTLVPLIRVDGDDVRITGLRIWGPEPEDCPLEWVEEPNQRPNADACTWRQPCSAVCIADDDDEDPRRCLIANPSGPGLIESSCIADGLCFNEAGNQLLDCSSDTDSCAEYYETSPGVKKCYDDLAERNCSECTRPEIGIRADGIEHTANNLEVDNCDLAGFAHAGIMIDGAEDANLHHNYIHHVQRRGLGYPVVITGRDSTPPPTVWYAASATIEYNRFQNYRHAVASSGGAQHEYDARYNLALEKTIGRVFDIHSTESGINDPSGGLTLVHNNVIFPDDYFSFDVRGIPTIGAYFYSNCTARSENSGTPPEVVDCGGNPWPDGDTESNAAVCQRNGSGTNVDIDTEPPPSNASAPGSYDEPPDECATPRWCVSSRGIRPYEYMASSEYGIDVLRYGDFDGDGVTDVFMAEGDWRVSYGGIDEWHVVKEDSTDGSQLLFGDFDGDGRTDVFRARYIPFSSQRVWEYVLGEPEPATENGRWDGTWHQLVVDTSGATVDELAVGRFDNDNLADVFNASGTEWRYREDGSATWTTLRTTATPMEDIALGFFDNDLVSDVFWADGTSWRYYPGGSGSAVTLDTDNDLRVFKLKFADLGGNSRTDVFYANGLRWRYKSAGTGAWIELALAAERYDEVVLGQFDDDPPIDVFFPDCH